MDEASDVKIWEYALHHDYLIVTQDADFYDLSLLHEAPPKLLWLRCGNQPTWVNELPRSRATGYPHGIGFV